MTNSADTQKVREIPLGTAALRALLDVSGADWPFDPAPLGHWLGADSPFLADGRANVLYLPGAGAILATYNPWMTAGTVATFSCLRLADALSVSERASAVTELMDAVRRWGRRHGATQLRGPLLYSTWYPYRVLADDRTSEPAGFAGEGVEPALNNDWYRVAGLAVTDRYVTMAPPDNRDYWSYHLAREASISARRGGGWLLRPLSARDGASLLPEIHGWLQVTFAHNPYFSPLAGPEFAARVLAGVPEEVTPIRLGAFDVQGTIKGILTGHLAEGRGVLKTIAVSPDTRGGRCAMALTFEFHRMLFAQGVTRVWHALMHVDNLSARMSAKYAQPVRHYVLYGASLD